MGPIFYIAALAGGLYTLKRHNDNAAAAATVAAAPVSLAGTGTATPQTGGGSLLSVGTVVRDPTTGMTSTLGAPALTSTFPVGTMILDNNGNVIATTNGT